MASVHLAAPPALQQLEYLGLGQQGLGEALLQIQIQIRASLYRRVSLDGPYSANLWR